MWLFLIKCSLTLILLTWRIGWAPNNARKQQIRFNSAFKGLMNVKCTSLCVRFYILILVFFGFVYQNPGRSRRIFKGEKILSTPSFGGEVKPCVPCCRFAACKRSLELRGSRILDEICRNISRPQRVPPPAARGLSRRWTWRHLAEKVGTSKGGGKQWQPTPKNLLRIQRARAIPVAWLGSGSC